ncbi:hypothetical protein [Chitinophaga sp. YR573]|nr:hypothetical protein [Chitinophaga sp. YR573]
MEAAIIKLMRKAFEEAIAKILIAAKFRESGNWILIFDNATH